MGILFKAYDRALRRTVALKRLPRWMADSPRAVALFLEEARSAASLSHPHIVTVHDVVREGNTYFVTMEYLDGWTLRRLVERQGPMPAADMVRVARQVLSALAYAHGQDVIHRDIKTQNLMMTRQGIVKLTDFGLARVVAEMAPGAQTDKGSGTPCYVAPEQIEGRADSRSDLYSLGVCLFELSTGQLPFIGPDVLEQQRSAKRPRANEVVPTVPPLLANVIERLMNPDPAERFQAAEEALGVLEWLER
jgi:serine/threonine-protein kinase